MSDRITKLREDFNNELEKAGAEADAKTLKDRWVGRGMASGKSGVLIEEMKKLGGLSPDERRAAGQRLNELKNYVEAEIEKLQGVFAAKREAEQLAKERIDVTLPGRRIRAGHLHPITLLRQKIEDIFVSLGYAIEDGREIETDFYNFDALNIPANHPARSPQDTFYINDRLRAAFADLDRADSRDAEAPSRRCA